ncbi:hypothetical protein [Schlesneria sp. DSM 10557]|uniref:hypothetical protein n=1 Tax=Schlesneria sp. DSM 10557 TaxID=3044399 RepID=UPI0035A1D0C5
MRLTITDVAATIHSRHGGELIPAWKMRRVVDALDARNAIDIQRVGVYRTLALEDVDTVANELRRLNWLPQAESVSC